MKLLVFGAMFLALNLFTFALSVVNLVKGGDIIYYYIGLWRGRCCHIPVSGNK